MSTTDSPSGGDSSGSGDRRFGQGLTVMAMSLLILVLAYVALRELTQVLRPLLVAVFICYLIVPAHRWLVRHRLPSMVSYFVIVGAFFAVCYGVGNMAYRSVGGLTDELPSYVHDLEAYVQQTLDDWGEKFADVLPGDDENSPEEAVATDDEAPSTLPAAVVDGAVPSSPEPGTAERPERSGWRLFSADQLTSMGRSTLETFRDTLAAAFVILILLFFLLAEVASFERRVVGAFGEQRGVQVMDVIGKINIAVSKYIAVKTFVSLLVGVLSVVILMIFGVKYALMWGIITFFFNFIPYVGSLVAVTLPIAMSFVQFGHEPWRPIIIAVLLTVAQQLVGSVIEPRMIGQKLGVSPLIILLSLAFWGMLWGVPGMILSAPLVVSVKIVLENIDQTKPVARLCSNV